jgi:hypothetical protein
MSELSDDVVQEIKHRLKTCLFNQCALAPTTYIIVITDVYCIQKARC